MDVFDQNEDGSSCFLIFVLFDIRFLPFLKTLKNQKCHFLSWRLDFLVEGRFLTNMNMGQLIFFISALLGSKMALYS